MITAHTHTRAPYCSRYYHYQPHCCSLLYLTPPPSFTTCFSNGNDSPHQMAQNPIIDRLLNTNKPAHVKLLRFTCSQFVLRCVSLSLVSFNTLFFACLLLLCIRNSLCLARFCLSALFGNEGNSVYCNPFFLIFPGHHLKNIHVDAAVILRLTHLPHGPSHCSQYLSAGSFISMAVCVCVCRCTIIRTHAIKYPTSTYNIHGIVGVVYVVVPIVIVILGRLNTRHDLFHLAQ